MKLLHTFAALAFAPAALLAQAGQVVGQNGLPTSGNTTAWIPDVRGGATAQVTTLLPCGTAASGACSGGYGNVGTGSLQLGVTGTNVGGEYPDWGFYYRYANGSLQATLDGNASFGDLRSLSSLSFDWFRSSIPGWNATPPVGAQPINPIDWLYKTPVVRLQLLETRTALVDSRTVTTQHLSELVWEGYYNQPSLGMAPTPVDSWVRQTNMQSDNFWYVRPPASISGNGLYSQNGVCDSPMSFWAGGVNASNASNLFSATGCLFGAQVQVIGIAVGVGSQWPLEWRGAADNVRLGFGTGGASCATMGGDACVLDANFDIASTTVPEPSTWALMGAGLLAMGVAARRRRRVDR